MSFLSISQSQNNYAPIQDNLQELASLFQPGELLNDQTISSLMHRLNRLVQTALPKKNSSTFFASFPREIWTRITDFLSLKDIGRFSQVVAQIFKEQNGKVHIENRAIDLIKSSRKKSKEALLLAVAKGNINLFNLLEEVHECLLDKSFVLAAKKNQLNIMQAIDATFTVNTSITRKAYLLAADHGSKEVIQYLENNRDAEMTLPAVYRYIAFSRGIQSNEISGCDLSLFTSEKLIEALWYASALGNDQVIDTLIKDPSFNAINNEAIEETLLDTAKEDRLICFQLLFNCGRNDLDIEIIGDTLNYAAINGNAEMVQVIMNSPRFNEIPKKFLGEALNYAAEVNSQKILHLLLNCGRFNEISKSDLSTALECAAKLNHYKIVITFIECQRFHEINKANLGLTLVYACKLGSLKMLDALMGSDRFSDIPKTYLDQSIECAAQKGKITILRKLMTSDRFHEISPLSLKKALKYAAENGFEKIVKILMSQSFDEIDLEVALLAAVKNEQLKTASLLAEHSEKVHAVAIIYSVTFNQKEILDDLINSPHFQSVSPEQLGYALKIGVEHNHHAVLESLIGSSQFQKIPVDYLASALIDANKKQYETIEGMLIESGRYDESALAQMSPNTRETVSVILEEYAGEESAKKRRKTGS